MAPATASSSSAAPQSSKAMTHRWSSWALLVASVGGALAASIAHCLFGDRWRGCWRPRGYYAVLGVCETATSEDIRRVAAELRSQAPKDSVAVDADAKALALQTLLDPVSRARHDLALRYGLCSFTPHVSGATSDRAGSGASSGDEAEQHMASDQQASPLLVHRRGGAASGAQGAVDRWPVEGHVSAAIQRAAYEELSSSAGWRFKGEGPSEGFFWHQSLSGRASPSVHQLVKGLVSVANATVGARPSGSTVTKLNGVSAVAITYGMPGVSLAAAAAAHIHESALPEVSRRLLVYFVNDNLREVPDPGGELVLLSQQGGGQLEDFVGADVSVAVWRPKWLRSGCNHAHRAGTFGCLHAAGATPAGEAPAMRTPSWRNLSKNCKVLDDLYSRCSWSSQ